VLPDEGLDEEALHGVEVGHGLLVAALGVGADGGEFEAVESALAGQGLALVAGPDALPALRIVLADQDGQQRVVAKAIVVDEVFIAEAEADRASSPIMMLEGFTSLWITPRSWAYCKASATAATNSAASRNPGRRAESKSASVTPCTKSLTR
jgi:hypothetical protein